MPADEVRRRAATGAAVLGARGLVVYALGIVANLVLASLLVPRDFGLFAVGTVFVVIGTYLAQGGFAAALIRRERPATRGELEAVLGAQLALTTAIALSVCALAAPFGRDGFVVATMAGALPFVVLRTPSIVVLERSLRYRTIAGADLAEALAYYAWAVGTVAAGLGVWGLASGVVVRAIVGSVTVTVRGPVGFIRPRWSWPAVRPLVGFGARFQAAEALYVAREQGLNIVVGAVAGLGVLGVWNLAWRVMQVPNLLFLTVGRVAFPAAGRLLDAQQDVRPAIERGAAVLAAITGFVTAGLVGASVALPAIVGDDWADVPEVILWSCVGLVVASPIAVATRGYLFAVDDAGTIARGLLLSAVAWFGFCAALLPDVGPAAVGMGWVVAGVLNAIVLWRRTTELTGAAIARHLWGPTVAALLATVGAWLVAQEASDPLLGGAIGLLAGELTMLACLLVLGRSALREAGELMRQAWRTIAA